MWIDDIKNWTKLDTYEKIKRNASDRLKWRTYTTTCHRRLADGNVNCAGSATYQICFRLPIPNPNPNPITDPNPKINKKTKRHRNEIEHSYI